MVNASLAFTKILSLLYAKKTINGFISAFALLFPASGRDTGILSL